MAFAKKGGWETIKEPLLAGNKTVEILVGLNFGITDPSLLANWLDLGIQNPQQFKVRVAPRLPVFHPKVIVIHDDGASCAIVGSGNLTGGGQLHNIECGVFVEGNDAIDELEKWYCKLKSVPLTGKIIELYRPIYERSTKARKLPPDTSSGLDAALNEGGLKWYKNAFLKEFRQFLLTPRGKSSLGHRIQGASKVREALRIPSICQRNA
jgi:hypothetical protein